MAHAINSGLTVLYWHLGDRIHREILKEARAEYGAEIVSALGRQLEREFGRGFAEKNLRRMVQFAEVFPDREIVVSLIRQLTWTHFIALIPLKDPLQRRLLRRDVPHRALERTDAAVAYRQHALRAHRPLEEARRAHRAESSRPSAKKTGSPPTGLSRPLHARFSRPAGHLREKDLEDALLREIESFLLELGAGFAFVERQKRITLDGDDYYLDLLFYHRRLRRLVVIELKIGDFKPADAGQMELYLRWLDRYERQQGEEKPIGLILCAGKKRETVEVA